MGIKTFSKREKTDSDKLVEGLTIREWFAGQFATRLMPRQAVIQADELIHFLNLEDPLDYIKNPAGKPTL